MKRLILSAAAALVLSAPALASPVKVTTAGLNLADPADAAVMLRRVDLAAAEACGADRGSVRDVQTAIRRTDCYAAAKARTLRALNAPALEAASRAGGLTQR
ncbi:MAG: UrcA family protein [Pseudomonadota bacterium]|jgi:UrcA family protein